MKNKKTKSISKLIAKIEKLRQKPRVAGGMGLFLNESRFCDAMWYLSFPRIPERFKGL